MNRIVFLVLRGWSKEQGQRKRRSLDQSRHTQASTQVIEYSSDVPKALKSYGYKGICILEDNECQGMRWDGFYVVSNNQIVC